MPEICAKVAAVLSIPGGMVVGLVLQDARQGLKVMIWHAGLCQHHGVLDEALEHRWP